MKHLLTGRFLVILAVVLIVAGVGMAAYAASPVFTHTGTISITVTNNPSPTPSPNPVSPVEGTTFTASQPITDGTTYSTGTILTFTNTSSYPVTVQVIPGTLPAGCTYTGDTSKVIPAGGSNTVTLSASAGTNYNGTYSIPITIEASY